MDSLTAVQNILLCRCVLPSLFQLVAQVSCFHSHDQDREPPYCEVSGKFYMDLLQFLLLLLSRLVKSGCPSIVSEPRCMVFSVNASNVAIALLFIYIICSVRSAICILFMTISPRIHTAIHVLST